MPYLIDTHTHVNFSAFKDDAEEVIKRALDAGIWLINVGSQSSTSRRAVEIAQNYKKGVYAAVGLHPSHLEETEINSSEEGEVINYKTRKEEFDENFYLKLAGDKKVVAIGECGLDYYRKRRATTDNLQQKEKQKEVFIKHIELSNKIKKPLIIHCRDAHKDLTEIIIAHRNLLLNPAGVMHFFTGTLEQALQYINLGFYISFSGVITFPAKADQSRAGTDYKELVENLPLDKILIETDAPYVSPVPYRGKRNEPLYVIEVAKKIAEIKGISLEETSRQITANSMFVFNLKQ